MQRNAFAKSHAPLWTGAFGIRSLGTLTSTARLVVSVTGTGWSIQQGTGCNECDQAFTRPVWHFSATARRHPSHPDGCHGSPLRAGSRSDSNPGGPAWNQGL